jgi:hypothetical protein
MAVLASAAYLEMALAGAAAVLAVEGTAATAVEALEIASPLVLPEGEERTLQMAVTAEGTEAAVCRFFSLEDEAAERWRLHATVHVRRAAAAGPKTVSLRELQARGPAAWNVRTRRPRSLPGSGRGRLTCWARSTCRSHRAITASTPRTRPACGL